MEVLNRWFPKSPTIELVPANSTDPNMERFEQKVFTNWWRIAFSLDYAVAKNRSIALTFGQDFEGNQTGNLLAAVNVLLGFGTARLHN